MTPAPAASPGWAVDAPADLGQTLGVTSTDRQSAVAARIAGAGALGLIAPSSAVVVAGSLLADPDWTAEVLARRLARQGVPDLRVAATVWWYSLSLVVLTPPLAGMVTGLPLSARLEDLAVSMLAGDQPIAATSSAPGRDPAEEIRSSVEAVVSAVAEAGRMRERPLWAIATDSLANQSLALGRARGDVPAAVALAGALASAIGPPLPTPRFVDVAGVRFTQRASCCLIYLLPGALCTSCPRRPPAERRLLLERAARYV
jgi:hypothetical protein